MLEKFFNNEELETLKTISSAAKDCEYKVYLVGGAVRNILLSKKPKDIDITVVGDAQKFIAKIQEKVECNIVKYQNELKTARISFKNGFVADIASTRKETYSVRKGIPQPSFFGCPLGEDLKRRDFTINAFVISLNENDFGKVYDFLNGIEDLKNKKIRILHDNSFNDDPTRIIRAFKFSKRLGFELEEKTTKLQEDYLKNRNYDIIVSPERVRKEMYDVFKLNSAEICKEFVEQKIYKVLTDKINEIDFQNIFNIIQKYKLNEEQIPFILFASLFFRKENLELFKQMNLRKNEIRAINDLEFVKVMMEKDCDLNVFKYYAIRSKESLVLEFILEKNDNVEIFLEELSKIKIEITGDDLIIMGISPSKNFSKIFDLVLDEKLKGNLPNKVSELKYVRQLLLNKEV